MSRRRALPAPPLVLPPVFARVSADSVRAVQLLELASFLERRGLLTDGGILKLEQGLRGRNRVVSLTLQDVRAWAHGLTVELLEQEPEDWPQTANSYFQRYDKGKPRKPTNLQRLILEWSRDRTWRGLLLASLDHPRIWERLETCLGQTEHHALGLALECHLASSWLPWKEQFAKTQDPDQLLELLCYLNQPSYQQRGQLLLELAQQALTQTALPGWSRHLPLACRDRDWTPPHSLRESLENVTLRILGGSQEYVTPSLLACFARLAVSGNLAPQVRKLIGRDSELARITYGPRPGVPWLEQLLSALP